MHICPICDRASSTAIVCTARTNRSVGHRFNPAKVLVDPYAKAIARPVRWDDAMFGYRIGDPAADLSRDDRDSAAFAPLAAVIDPTFDWQGDRPPATPWHKTVIYEAHVKGMTMLHPDVPPALRGTYAGLAEPAVIAHLQRLGVTAIELMPVHHRHPRTPSARSRPDQLLGLQHALLLRAGPSLRVDAIGRSSRSWSSRRWCGRFMPPASKSFSTWSTTTPPKAIIWAPRSRCAASTTPSYYWLSPEQPRYYVDFTGCGNTLNVRHPRVLQLLMDSLRYWALEMHVDGFRFDLASALARELYDVDKLARVLRRDSPGPGDLAAEAHRRAMGCRRRRLSGGQFSGAVDGMERPLP